MSVQQKRKRSSSSSGEKNNKKKQKLPSRKSVLKFASSAWILFSSQKRKSVREELKKENVDLQEDKLFGLTCKKLASQWKAMTIEQKKPYVLEFEKDKQRYIREKENLTGDQKKLLRLLKKQKKSKKKGSPKSSLSSYMIFVRAERAGIAAENPKMTFGEIGRALGKKWASLDLAAKENYHKMATVDRERYLSEMKTYKEKKN